MTERRDLYYLWIAIGSICAALMWRLPGDETIPYHVAWASFALLYGLGNWKLGRAATALVLYTLATGAVFVVQAARGTLPWQETTEIPLMFVLMVLMVWHVRRRQLALATVTAMAENERTQAADRERLTRLTSHELRTPLTIARGYLELIVARETDPLTLRDLEIVEDELNRLTRVTERLIRVIRLQGESDLELVDLDLLLAQTVERWAPVADRKWVVEADAGSCEGSAERVRASLDTLIENAVRYTQVGDTVRLSGRRAGGRIEIAVADSGHGLSAELILAISCELALEVPQDELSQTGLGLGLVRSLVSARGGRLYAGTSPEGGALLRMEFPVAPMLGTCLTESPGLDGLVSGSTSRKMTAPRSGEVLPLAKAG